MKMMTIKIYYTLAIAIIAILGVTDSYASNDKTIKDLKDAFAGETTATAKYKAFAEKARKEGYFHIATLFDAASKAESIHASNHKAVLQQLDAGIPEVDPEFEVKSTVENLKDAIGGESYEVTTMYPDFLTDAHAENQNLAMISLNYAYKVEKKHKALYEKALKTLKDGNESSLPSEYYVCTTCGNTYETEAPERCGISMTSRERFVKIVM